MDGIPRSASKETTHTASHREGGCSEEGASAGEDVERLDPVHVAGGAVRCAASASPACPAEPTSSVGNSVSDPPESFTESPGGRAGPRLDVARRNGRQAPRVFAGQCSQQPRCPLAGHWVTTTRDTHARSGIQLETCHTVLAGMWASLANMLSGRKQARKGTCSMVPGGFASAGCRTEAATGGERGDGIFVQWA